MTDKVFWQDPYLDHLRTEVSAIDGDIVRLRATIFYANAGGQESDSGTIAGIAVLKAKRTAWTSPTRCRPAMACTPAMKWTYASTGRGATA